MNNVLPTTFDRAALRKPDAVPTLSSLAEQRAADLRRRGYPALAAMQQAAARPVVGLTITPCVEPAPRRRYARTFVRLMLAVILSTLAWYGATTDGATAAPAPSVCPAYEDDPAWSWSQCGNNARGVRVKGVSRVVVVNVCQYVHLRAAGLLSVRNAHFKGDGHAWAMRAECFAQTVPTLSSSGR